MEVTSLNNYSINKKLLKRIVYSINKAITQDIPEYLTESAKETNNAVIHLRGDYINHNLRRYALYNNEIDLIPFRRFFWQGRILLDSTNKITYSICSSTTLHRIPKKKDRSNPHFLQSILAVENSECKCEYVQDSLFPIDAFDYKTLEDDYKNTFSLLANSEEGFTHYVISYEANNNQVISINLEVLDPHFNIVFERSLNDYIVPDFADLTQPSDTTNNTQTESESTKSLIGFKPGIRPSLIEFEKEG